MSAANDNVTDEALREIYERAVYAVFNVGELRTKRGLDKDPVMVNSKVAYNVLFGLRGLVAAAKQEDNSIDQEQAKIALRSLTGTRVLSHGRTVLIPSRDNIAFAQQMVNLILPEDFGDRLAAMRVVRDVIKENGGEFSLDTAHYDEQLAAAIRNAGLQVDGRDFEARDVSSLLAFGLKHG